MNTHNNISFLYHNGTVAYLTVAQLDILYYMYPSSPKDNRRKLTSTISFDWHFSIFDNFRFSHQVWLVQNPFWSIIRFFLRSSGRRKRRRTVNWFFGNSSVRFSVLEFVKNYYSQFPFPFSTLVSHSWFENWRLNVIRHFLRFICSTLFLVLFCIASSGSRIAGVIKPKELHDML